jgi:hypothetical protein
VFAPKARGIEDHWNLSNAATVNSVVERRQEATRFQCRLERKGNNVMYCSACGAAMAPGLSYCNRCGMSLKERDETKPSPISAYLSAITVIGIAGLGLMLGGAIALKNGAQFREDLIGFFMLMTFLIVGVVEILLCRQLSRFVGTAEKRESLREPPQSTMPSAFSTAQPRTLAEPISSVTENTTRTLDYSRNEPLRQRTMGQKIEEES